MTDETPAPSDAASSWLAYAPKPRPRPPGLAWDVFISYRSVSRPWALALYDTLQEARFSIFLDQFVLQPGDRLDRTLAMQLERSASAVLVWTREADESEWVQAEYDAMKALARKRREFHFVIAKLDQHPLPFLEQQTKYVDFTQYPEGPRGGELLELMFGLVGEPLSRSAVTAIQALNEETARTLRAIKAARDIGDAQQILDIGLGTDAALLATPVPISLAAEALIALKKHPEALSVLDVAQRRFPRSIRPRQLAGLAYRRNADIPAAQRVLADLYAEGHRDPETLGIYAATWATRYASEKKLGHLERSQALYAEAFALVPTDYYVGINAASKLALLARPAEARALAAQVLDLVQDATDGTDYWKTVSHAEARVLCGEYETAATLYRRAVVRHSEETGSIGTSRDQLRALVDKLGVPHDESERLLKALEV